MGVNCLIMLPPDVRLSDAADVIGILAGLPSSKKPLSGNSYSCEVDGVTLKPSLPQMATVCLNGNLVDGEQNHSATWHWEPDNGTGERLLYPRASGFWIAVGRRLIEFFGGTIVYCDTGDLSVDYRVKKPRKRNNPSDGKPWQQFQDDKLALTPLSAEELESAGQWAAYKSTQ